jgi:very-short-patch-repair endonuclease
MDVRGLNELSALQHNVVARAQARALGFDRWAIRRRIESGELVESTSRVLRRAGAAYDPHESVMTAVLDAGPDAVLSHESAAWLWGLPGFWWDPLHVVRQRRLVNGTNLHRPRLLLPHHVTEVRGVPVTSLPVTIVHLAGQAHLRDARLARAVASVVGRAPSLLPVLDQALDEMSTPGRPGIRRLRAILAQQDRSGVRTTGLERRFAQLLAEAGEPPMERQVDLGGHAWIGRVDCVDRALRLVAEIDSITYHSSRADQLRDAARDEALLAAGWRKVVRIAEEWIWYEPARAVALVREARRELRAAAA